MVQVTFVSHNDVHSVSFPNGDAELISVAEDIEFSVSGLFLQAPLDEMSDLWNVLAKAKCAKTLAWNFASDVHFLHPSTLVEVINRISPIAPVEHLQLRGNCGFIALTGNEEDKAELALSIRQSLPSLVTFDFRNMCDIFPVEEEDTVDEVIYALLSKPTLNTVCLGSHFSRASNKAFCELCASPFIQDLDLIQLRLSDHRLVSVAEVLAENKSLLEVKLYGTGLTAFRGCTAISLMLKLNHTLHAFTIEIDNIDNDSVAAELLQGIKASKLKRASILCTSRQMSRKTEKVAIKMLQNNLSLVHFSCMDSSKKQSAELETAVETYLPLNIAGRQNLLRNNCRAHAGDWVDALIELKERVGSTFYLLSENPGLFCGSKNQTTTSLVHWVERTQARQDG
jgi:hypothetical protein